MKDKFIMNLVWHNCKTHPPKEEYKDFLYATNGKYLFEVAWNRNEGWTYKKYDWQIPSDELHEYWWADIDQTIQATKEFVPVVCEPEADSSGKCGCYHEREETVFWGANTNVVHWVGVCNGTKEREKCNCGGNCAKCDFYPHIRERAKEEFKI